MWIWIWDCEGFFPSAFGGGPSIFLQKLIFFYLHNVCPCLANAEIKPIAGIKQQLLSGEKRREQFWAANGT